VNAFDFIANDNTLLYITIGGLVGINETANTKMTQGLTINQGTNDNEILAFKSSDVAHGYTDYAETDTYGTFSKYGNTTGGLKISAIRKTSSAGVLGLLGATDTFNTTKTGAGRAIVEVVCYGFSGSSLANVGANANCFAVTPVKSGSTTAVFIVDADGDTWQSGDLHLDGPDIFLTVENTVTGAANVDLKGIRGATANSDIARVRAYWDGNNVSEIRFNSGIDTGNKDDGAIAFFTSVASSSPTERMRIAPGGIIGINDTLNAKMTIGLTINQAGNDDEILAFKSSDVAHALVVVAETDTFTQFMKNTPSNGGMLVRTLMDNVAYENNLLFECYGGQADTTKSTAGRALAEFYLAQHDGNNSAADVAANGNLLAIRARTVGTVWILDEDGDTWQSGNVVFSGGRGVRNSTSDGSDDSYIHFCGGGDFGNNYGGYIALYGNEHGSEPGRIQISPGDTSKLVEINNSPIVCINDTANAKMTIGLTINQAGNDDEILAFKSSDVAHGMTNITETDTYGYFRKVIDATGALQIRGFGAGDYGIGLYCYYTTDDTTKSTAGVAPFQVNVQKKSGAGAGAQGANANLAVFRSSNSTKWILDEDGDTWQSGYAGIGTAAGAIYPLEVRRAGGGCTLGVQLDGQINHRDVLYFSYGDTTNVTCGHVFYTRNATADNVLSFAITPLGKCFINDTLNAKMTTGLTINQGGADDEILAFKSSDVAHGMTTDTETDTFAHFTKAEAVGGLIIRGFSSNIYGLRLLGQVDGALNTTKGTAARGVCEIQMEYKSNGVGGYLTADANLLVIRNWATAVWHLDEDGDTWQSGSITIADQKYIYWGDSNEYIFANNNGTMIFGVSGASRMRIGGAIVYIGDDSTNNANMSIGLTINQTGGQDNEILALKSSDVTHALVSQAETDTFGTMQKATAAGGGLYIKSIHQDANNAPVFILGSYGGQAPTVKTTAGRSLIELIPYEHDGADAIVNTTANGNLVGIRTYTGGFYQTRWLVDADGDTWQSGGGYFNGQVTINQATLFVTGGEGETALIYMRADQADNNSDIWRLRASDGDQWSIDSFSTGSYVSSFRVTSAACHLGHTSYINETANTKATIGLTINQAANDDEILAFKSGDVGHVFTTIAEADTYCSFRKADGNTGGLMVYTFSEGNYSTWIRGCVALETSTKSAAGLAPIVLEGADTDGGTSIQALPSNSNLVAIRNMGNTQWICDAEGDTWQSGGAEFGGIVTKPAQPAFCIFLDGNFTITPDDVNDVVEFDDEHFDQGSNFNVGTYTFTAPVTGKYQFNVTLTLGTVDLDADYMYLKLVTDNREYRGGYLFPAAYDTDLDDLSISMSVLADMTAGHTAFVEVYQTGGNASTVKSAAGLSHFSGFLAC
jgi:hypothetical protein